MELDGMNVGDSIQVPNEIGQTGVPNDPLAGPSDSNLTHRKFAWRMGWRALPLGKSLKIII